MLADEIKAGESVNMEFKSEVPAKSEKYIKSVVAFANTAGGKIIIGIDDKTHDIVGVDKDEVFKIMNSITNTISDMCYPQIFPNIRADTLEGKSVIVVEIYPGADRPYYIKSFGKESGTYIRVSGTSRPADGAILKDLELQGANRSFDEMVCVEEKYDAEEADKLCGAIKEYMVEAAKTKSEKEKVKDVTVQNLVNWGILKSIDGTFVPTNAFILLTKNTFPFAKIQCALFKGTERVVFIDKRDFEGPLYLQIEEAYEFVLKHINLGAEISGLVRTDVYELPTEAIREAIVNAVAHRNFMYRSCVQVAVYDDRVEITSPGMLYGGLTVGQIKEGGSKIRNRCIAEVFGRMRLIENWGTGIKRMIASCREYGVREPEFLEIGDSFRVNLYRPSYEGEILKGTLKSSPKGTLKSSPKSSSKSSPEGTLKSSPKGITENSLKSSPKALPKSSPKGTSKASPKTLNATQQKIMEMILENPGTTQAAMAKELHITVRAVKSSIKDLAEKGVIRRVGPARGGFWEIKNDGK